MPKDGALAGPPPILVCGATRVFGRDAGLHDVSLRVGAGEIHALLGPNGAGKTTLVRILAGLLEPASGTVTLCGLDPARHSTELRRRVGLVPSGDRSFYLRISALENLVFFARLHGLGLRDARAHALEALERVGLADAARSPRVGLFSHGMQKRLSVARAFLTQPDILLVDEATHDLDPDGARRVRELVAGAAADGAAVVWATQRLDELRGFAGAVTLLDHGRSRFEGTVEELASQVVPSRFIVQLRNGGAAGEDVERRLAGALRGLGRLSALADSADDHYRLELEGGARLGAAMSAIAGEQVEILACRNEGSELEEAFLALTGGGE
jgi:ABC-2 type transport system ATP-binding protein